MSSGWEPSDYVVIKTFFIKCDLLLVRLLYNKNKITLQQGNFTLKGKLMLKYQEP